MILKLISALVSPDFTRIFFEIWSEFKKQQKQQASLAVDKGFEQAEKQKDTEALASEIGKLIK